MLRELAIADQVADDISGARERSAEALTIAKACGAERLEAIIKHNLAEAEFRGGKVELALRLGGEALRTHRVSNDTLGAANSLSNMAAYLAAVKRYDEARSYAHEALPLFRDVQSEVHLVVALQHLAAVAAFSQGDCRRAARLLGYIDARLTALEARREYTERQEYDELLDMLRNAFAEVELAKLIDDGGAWDEDQAIAEALLI